MWFKDVRLITKIENIDILKQVPEKVDEKTLADIIDSAEINKKVGDIIYLGWDYLKPSYVRLIRHSMFELEDKDLSYRLSIIDYGTDEIEELEYTSEQDAEKYIPYPSILRAFDEKDMEKTLINYEKSINEEKNKEMIDYEHSI